MNVVRIARPRICREFVHHGLTLGCLLRLTVLRAGKLECKRVSGNSRVRRTVSRQVRRAIASTDSGDWLIAVHSAALKRGA